MTGPRSRRRSFSAGRRPGWVLASHVGPRALAVAVLPE